MPAPACARRGCGHPKHHHDPSTSALTCEACTCEGYAERDPDARTALEPLDVRRLHVVDGDVLVVHGTASAAIAGAVVDQLRSWFPDARVMVLPAGLDVAVITAADLAAPDPRPSADDRSQGTQAGTPGQEED